jgi:hypothetical protein
LEQFSTEISAAMQLARNELSRAQQEGDEESRIVHLGRLEELQRIAADHGLAH